MNANGELEKSENFAKIRDSRVASWYIVGDRWRGHGTDAWSEMNVWKLVLKCQIIGSGVRNRLLDLCFECTTVVYSDEFGR